MALAQHGADFYMNKFFYSVIVRVSFREIAPPKIP